MNEVDLDFEPYCAECEAGFSEPDRTEQVSVSISALETVLSRINGHVSAAAVQEILSDQESPEMVKLLRLGEASNIDIERAAAESGTTAFVGEYLSQRTDA